MSHVKLREAAFFDALDAGLLRRVHWWPNIVAGVVVGVVALPLAMAFAIASGAKPEQGLYTAIVAGAVVSLMGGSRVQIAGPTGAFVAVLSAIVMRHGMDGLQLATLMAGLILMGLGWAGLGGIARYIPTPVILGFTCGIGVIIWVGEWADFMGLPAATGAHFHEKLLALLQSLPQVDVTTTLLSVFSLLVVLVGPRVSVLKRIPGPLIALVVATLLEAVFRFPTVRTIGSAFGGIPQGLPTWHLPVVTAARLIELVGPAFAIAMLGAIESLLSAVVADGMSGTQHRPNQELIGQGLANVLVPLVGGFAATGAIARTATNVRNGGTSPLAGVVHSVTLVAVILLLAPLAVHIPLAVLAAILFVVAWNMADLKHVYSTIRRAPRADVAILLITLLLTVFVDIVVAVNIGVILATLQFLRRMASSVEVTEASPDELGAELKALRLPALPAGVVVYAIQGPFFFGAVESFERALAGTHTDPKVVMIRLRWVPFIDLTGLQALDNVIGNLKRRQVRVILVGANDRVTQKLVRAGIVAQVGSQNVFPDFAEAVAACAEY
jgi:SulP family sulfate permease